MVLRVPLRKYSRVIRTARHVFGEFIPRCGLWLSKLLTELLDRPGLSALMTWVDTPMMHRTWRKPVDIRSLEDLRQADERTLRFTPSGFDTGGMLRPEDAAVYQQEVIGHTELVAAVAENTRSTFERLCLLHAYGVLSYDMFTAADDLAQLVIEQALRDRFMEFHDGVVPFEDANGTVHEVPAASFDALHDKIHAEGRLRSPQRWRLRLRRTGELIYFDGMLASLLRWAHSEGLIRGQRNRQLEPVLRKLRNHVAHGGGYQLVMPMDSARTISEAVREAKLRGQ